MTDTERTGEKRSTTYRLVTAAFGALFTLIAIAIVVVSELTVGVALAAVVIGILGLDAVISAYRNAPSLLARIGPLP
ncbi:hypothetical protein [Hydrogenophaga sp.]|uniref:hypothetical protein n=1 Tax=Hydrogenophaga sp. TaxID=1904254 RepID=UPI0035680A74